MMSGVTDAQGAETTHERCDACGFSTAPCSTTGAMLDSLQRAGSASASLLLAPRRGVAAASGAGGVVGDRVRGPQPGHHGAARVRGGAGADDRRAGIPGDRRRRADPSAASTYEDADPDAVAAELEQQASSLAELAGDAGPGNWSRGLTIGDNRSDVRRLLEHTLHDSQHHLADVDHGLDTLRG